MLKGIKTSFGWYLPTSGQWGQITKNLGNFNLPTGSVSIVSNTDAGVVEGEAENVRTNINSYLTAASTYNQIQTIAELNTQRWYWCAGEFNSSYAFMFEFGHPKWNYKMYYFIRRPKTTTNDGAGNIFYSRPVIAF